MEQVLSMDIEEPFTIIRGMKIPIKIYKVEKDGNEKFVKKLMARK